MLLLRSQKPSEDVWVLSTLYEMVFLKQALERLDWQADELASQHKGGVITGQLVVLMVSCHGCQVRGGGQVVCVQHSGHTQLMTLEVSVRVLCSLRCVEL